MTTNPRTWAAPFGVPPWWVVLFKDPDFWQRWIDRYEELRAGPFSTSDVFGRMDGFANQVRQAQPREQARWGILPRSGLLYVGWATFDFGNLTTAIVLSNVFLRQAGLPPFFVLAEHKAEFEKIIGQAVTIETQPLVNTIYKTIKREMEALASG